MHENLNSTQRQIIELQIEHRDLDYMIDTLSAAALEGQSAQSFNQVDDLQLRRLKKRRLKIKDMITLLQIQLEPDIPA